MTYLTFEFFNRFRYLILLKKEISFSPALLKFVISKILILFFFILCKFKHLKISDKKIFFFFKKRIIDLH